MNETSQQMISFGEAFSRFWTRWTFRGRAARSEYWWAIVMVAVIGVVGSAVIPDPMVGMGLVMLWNLATIFPCLAVQVRRLHDTNRSGWWVLLLLVPLVGPIVLLVFMLQASQPTENRFGPVPNTVVR